MELFRDFFEPGYGAELLSRWGHYLAGVTWIGLLYYFNFVQTPAFAEMTAESRSEALRKITWRALWWFRFGALLTLLTGLMILGFQKNLGSDFSTYFQTVPGTSIAFGAIVGITMFTNVWVIIWPAQKIVIGSAERVAAGGEADPRAATVAKPAARASRANTLMSIPMLFFMAFTTHGVDLFRDTGEIGGDTLLVAWIVFVVVLAAIEGAALGWFGGYDGPLAKVFFDDHKMTIMWGFVAWVVLYFVAFEAIIA
ncbi:MAG: urate hydroxylase PuuD [Acidimicrobiia bacterium]|nr:urate hydroxylase PuuD [Acidimicrobiia bacterium]